MINQLFFCFSVYLLLLALNFAIIFSLTRFLHSYTLSKNGQKVSVKKLKSVKVYFFRSNCYWRCSFGYWEGLKGIMVMPKRFAVLGVGFFVFLAKTSKSSPSFRDGVNASYSLIICNWRWCFCVFFPWFWSSKCVCMNTVKKGATNRGNLLTRVEVKMFQKVQRSPMDVSLDASK